MFNKDDPENFQAVPQYTSFFITHVQTKTLNILTTNTHKNLGLALARENDVWIFQLKNRMHSFTLFLTIATKVDTKCNVKNIYMEQKYTVSMYKTMK